MKKFNIGDKAIIKGHDEEVGTIVEIKERINDGYYYKLDIFSPFLNEERLEFYKKNFTKDMLRSGMKVKLRNGLDKIILRDSLLEVTYIHNPIRYKEYSKLSNYTDDLIHVENDSWDIMKVYDEEDNLLWYRDESVNWGKIKFGTDIIVWEGNKLPIKAKFIKYEEGESYPFTVWSYEKDDVDYYSNGKLMEDDE